VQEIGDEATLNLATFYLHYPDKNALLQAMTGVRFRALTEHRGITFTDCNGALRAIALGVCDYLADTTGCPSQLVRIPLEGSIIPVVEGCSRKVLPIMGWRPGADAALLATTAAWAVFGAARRWFQTPNRISAEEMAAGIETMVSPILFGASQQLKSGNLSFLETEVLAASHSSAGVAHLRSRFHTCKSLRKRQNPGDTLSG
jgi:AcrR family transcriptional regulator